MLVLLDNGHGGIIEGVYQTPGKRSPIWKDGSQLFEGEFNRAVVNRIVEALTGLGVNYVNIAPEYHDVSLKTRVERANRYANAPCFYLSVHSNSGGGCGFEVFTSPGDDKSDKIAEIFGIEYQNVFPDKTLRADHTDNDLDKEQRFYVLTHTKMPSILTESFFMDNEQECKSILMTRQGRDKIAQYHLNAILKVKQQVFNT
ncbi:N-acetylmuramoyl-L-alanine amidase [Flagellimonas meridianipacifica]|uniref:N-acetylmuramoyl-L-alanine amidase n=1 Tax=Flagellimonas meridianipacifica TaxID=1080225 RepID=A0A2T0M8B2_9FLAO|nr:N-acetylmuramoyl-L-alanine amidase [Allomuricauda pacifica]PRX53776.1 N-acetylmuramoyl-L-alanine amidase [Allomuricauda pacifica]